MRTNIRLALALLVITTTACGGSSGLAGLGSKESGKGGEKKTVEKKADGGTEADETITDTTSSTNVSGSFLVGCEIAPTEQAAIGPEKVAYGCFVQDGAGKKAAQRRITGIELTLKDGKKGALSPAAAAAESKYHAVFGLTPAEAGELEAIGVTHTDLAGKDEKKVEHAEKNGKSVTSAPVGGATGPGPGAPDAPTVPGPCLPHTYRPPGTDVPCEQAEELMVFYASLGEFDYVAYELKSKAEAFGKALPGDEVSGGVGTGIYFLPPLDSACKAGKDEKACMNLEAKQKGTTIHIYELKVNSIDEHLQQNFRYVHAIDAAGLLNENLLWTLVRVVGRLTVVPPTDDARDIETYQHKVTSAKAGLYDRFQIHVRGDEPPTFAVDWTSVNGLGYSIP